MSNDRKISRLVRTFGGVDMKVTNFRADEITLSLLDQLHISSESQKKAEIIRAAIYSYALQELGKEQVDEIVSGVIALEKQGLL